MTAPTHEAATWWPLLWNSGTMAMAFIGPQRRYADANPLYCRLLETDAATLLTWPYERLCPAGDLDNELDAMVRLKDGAPSCTYQRRFRTAREREFTATVHVCAGPDKTLLQIVIPTESTVRATSDAADQRAWSSLTELGNALSHDALEPVRMSTMHLSLIGHAPLEGRAATSLTVLTSALLHLRRQLLGLVEFARLARPVIAPVPVPLSTLITQAHADKPIAPLDITIAPGSLRCDPLQVSAALRHLLSNAVTFSRAGSPASIRIAIATDNDQDILSVTDDGVGIPPADQPRLFRLFATGGRDAPYGPGVGLAFCRAVVEGHGGRAWLTSDGNRGTTVSLSFPH